MQVFNLIARGNATSRYHQWFQMMSFYHLEKDLNENEHLNLNLENKTPH